jgi:hypothetical protein
VEIFLCTSKRVSKRCVLILSSYACRFATKPGIQRFRASNIYTYIIIIIYIYITLNHLLHQILLSDLDVNSSNCIPKSGESRSLVGRIRSFDGSHGL